MTPIKILDELRVPPTGVPFVYGTAALLAAKRGNRIMWAVHRRGLDRVGKAVVPDKVLTQFKPVESQPLLVLLLLGCDIKDKDMKPCDTHAGGEASHPPRDAGVRDVIEIQDVIGTQVVRTARWCDAGVLTSRPCTAGRRDLLR